MTGGGGGAGHLPRLLTCQKFNRKLLSADVSPAVFEEQRKTTELSQEPGKAV